MNKVLLVIPENSYKSNDFVTAAKKLSIPFSIITDSQQVSAEFSDNIIVTSFDKSITPEILNQLSDVTHVLPVDHSSLIYASKLKDSLTAIGNTKVSIKTAMNKYLSRAIFNEVTDFEIAHNYVNNIQDINDFTSRHGDAVLKPTMGTASNRVIKITKKNQNSEIISKIITECNKNELVIEEFIEGKEYAFEGMLIDSVLYNFVVFEKPVIYTEPYFEESIYITPSDLSDTVVDMTKSKLQDASLKLGLENGPIHAEFKIIDSNIFIIEINPRMIGGLCSRCLSFGLFKISLEELILSSFISNQFKELELLSNYVGVLMLPVPNTGKFISINDDELKGIQNISSVDITVTRDSQIKMPPHGEKYLGFVFSQVENKNVVLTALEKALEKSSPVIEY